MSELKTQLPTDVWVVASWEEFVDIADNPAYEKAKCYYRNGQMRVETMSVGPDRASDCTIALLAGNRKRKRSFSLRKSAIVQPTLS